jgi:hypothetical protein
MKLIIWLVAIALIWGGGQGVYEAATNRAPQSISCEQANKTPPAAAWLNLTGCRINVIYAAYTSGSNGAPDGDIYLPLLLRRDAESSEANAKERLHYVVATRDPAIVSVVKEMNALDGKDSSVILYAAKNMDRVMFEKNVVGMVQSGINRREKIVEKLRSLNDNLQYDFVVIEEGKEPSVVWSAAVLTAGAALFLFLSSRLVARKA